MSNFVISAAGALAGNYFLGPLGAQLGWMVGSYLSADKADLGQATIGDLRVQTASYGSNIPLVVGVQRIAGNIIWASQKKTYKIEAEGGKGGGSQAVGVGYTVSLAIALCKGPILGVRRVWENGALTMDSTTVSKPLPGTLYLGSNTQMPDPTMQSALGAGNVPAYRGLAYIVLNNFDLGASGVIPQFTFEVIREGGI